MFKKSKLKQLQKLTDQASSILVILDPESGFDNKVSAASLFLSLKEKGKKVEFLSPEPLNNNTIIGFNQLKTDIGSRNLLVSFDYDEESVAKVSYHIDEEEEKFYLTIKPKEGREPLDPETVEFEKAGSDADLIFLLGVDNLENLSQLYFGYEELYEDAALVSIKPSQAQLGDIDLDTNEYSCMSEAVADLIDGMGAGISSSVATNLFAGLNYSTNSFSSSTVTANTFESAAKLLRAGAKRGGDESEKKMRTKRNLKKTPPSRAQQTSEKKMVEEELVEKKQKTDRKTEQKQEESKSKKNRSLPVRPSGLKV